MIDRGDSNAYLLIAASVTGMPCFITETGKPAVPPGPRRRRFRSALSGIGRMIVAAAAGLAPPARHLAR